VFPRRPRLRGGIGNSIVFPAAHHGGSDSVGTGSRRGCIHSRAQRSHYFGRPDFLASSMLKALPIDSIAKRSGCCLRPTPASQGLDCRGRTRLSYRPCPAGGMRLGAYMEGEVAGCGRSDSSLQPRPVPLGGTSCTRMELQLPSDTVDRGIWILDLVLQHDSPDLRPDPQLIRHGHHGRNCLCLPCTEHHTAHPSLSRSNHHDEKTENNGTFPERRPGLSRDQCHSDRRHQARGGPGCWPQRFEIAQSNHDPDIAAIAILG
jgi:hypothetical protein